MVIAAGLALALFGVTPSSLAAEDGSPGLPEWVAITDVHRSLDAFAVVAEDPAGDPVHEEEDVVEMTGWGGPPLRAWADVAPLPGGEARSAAASTVHVADGVVVGRGAAASEAVAQAAQSALAHSDLRFRVEFELAGPTRVRLEGITTGNLPLFLIEADSGFIVESTTGSVSFDDVLPEGTYVFRCSSFSSGPGTFGPPVTHQDTIVWSLAFGDVDLPAVSAPPIPTPWDCDVNRSGTVDLTDVLVVLGTWGPCSFSCAADLDEDGVVGFPDLLSVLEHFGW